MAKWGKWGLMVGSAIALASIGVLSPLQAAGLSPDAALAEALRAQRRAIALQEGALQGEAAAALLERARQAQFVLVGEDHGFAEVPQFVQALGRSLGENSPENLVLEIGPYAANRLSVGILAGDIGASARAHPGTTPFVEWAGDAAMAASWVARGGYHALWGIDQEFLLAAEPDLNLLGGLAPDDAARDLVETYLTRATTAERTMMETHDPSGVLMLKLGDADFAALRAAIHPAPGSAADDLLTAMAESAQIYRENDSAPFESNRHRSALMKRQFMQHYREAAAQHPLPRAMFRMGAFHCGRGLSPTGQFDIGNLASELAESQGRQSFHVLVIAAAGSYNRKLPFLADPALRSVPYPAKDELAVLGVAPLLDQAFNDRWTVFDMEPLRRQRALREAGGAAFARLVYAYDAVVVIDHATAARELLAEH